MENLLTAIIDILEEHGRELGLSYIDEEYGQVEMLDSDNAETYPVTFPAVLVDSSGEQWEQLGRQHQKGRATVNVNIYIDCYHDTHAYSNTRHRVAERMELVRSITELLQYYLHIDPRQLTDEEWAQKYAQLSDIRRREADGGKR